jgi:hypothetical protein
MGNRPPDDGWMSPMKAMGAPILNGSASEWALGGERRGRGDRRLKSGFIVLDGAAGKQGG